MVASFLINSCFITELLGIRCLRKISMIFFLTYKITVNLTSLIVQKTHRKQPQTSLNPKIVLDELINYAYLATEQTVSQCATIMIDKGQ